MLWFCGGHGVCLTGAGPKGHVEQAVVAWLRRYVAGDTAVDTGPSFEWLADDAQWRSAADYPVTPGRADHRDRQRHARAQPGRRRLRHDRHRRPRRQRRQRAGHRPQRRADRRRAAAQPDLQRHRHRHPRLRPAGRRGRAASSSATRPRRSRSRSTAGRTRSRARSRRSRPPRQKGAKYTLQLTGGTLLYGPVRGVAAITFSQIDLTLPTIGAAAVQGGAGVLAPTRSACPGAASASASAARTRRSPSPASG